MRSEPPRREQLVSDEYVMRPPHSCHGPYHLFGDLVEQESLVKEPLVSSEDVVSPGPPDEGVMSSGPSSSSDDHVLVAEDSIVMFWKMEVLSCRSNLHQCHGPSSNNQRS